MIEDELKEYLDGIASDIKTVIRNELSDNRKHTAIPEFLNRSKIAVKWGYSCQSSLKKWQLPDFGIPAYFNGNSPMYSREKLYKIIDNPQYYKEQWNRLSIQEKKKIEDQYQQMKRSSSNN